MNNQQAFYNIVQLLKTKQGLNEQTYSISKYKKIIDNLINDFTSNITEELSYQVKSPEEFESIENEIYKYIILKLKTSYR